MTSVLGSCLDAMYLMFFLMLYNFWVRLDLTEKQLVHNFQSQKLSYNRSWMFHDYNICVRLGFEGCEIKLYIIHTYYVVQFMIREALSP